jgi:hypothetical protein
MRGRASGTMMARTSMELTDPKLGTRIADRYRLAERLGAGGMGVVYKGEDTSSGEPVAVKFLHEAFAGMPDLVKRFEREVQAMRRMAHPHVVRIVDSGVDGGVPYLVMEFQSGKALNEILDRGALPAARAVGIVRQVLAGVAAAHGSGVVHRDLKPDNIMLLKGVDGDFVKILDFGLAKMVQGTNGTQLTNTGFALGTPGYMAPEQANGENIDERADIYSVGVMLYHMVVGHKPFVADSPMAVLRMHMDDPPKPPRKAAPDANLSADLEAAILRALEKEPAKRWRSADAFARALEATSEGGASKIPLVDVTMQEIADSRTAMAKKPAAAQAKPARRWRVRLPWKWIARGALVAAVGIGLTLLWTRVWRPRQKKIVAQVDSAVENAKSALQHGQKQMDTAMETAKDAFHSLTDPEPAPGHNSPGARLEATSSAHPSKKPVRRADAQRLLAAGKLDDAIQALYQLRRQSPRSSDVALMLGHAYFGKNWRTDGLREYDEALKLRPSLRRNPRLIRNVVTALDDPTYKLASAIIHVRLGTAALAELKRTGRNGKNPTVQKRAARLAVELAHR